MNPTPEPTTPEPTTPPTSSRRRPLAIAAGVATLALAGAAFVSLPSTAAAEVAVDGPRMQAHGPEQMRGAERMQHRDQVDPAERSAHMAELAEQLGVDADALSATMEALRADMDAEREATRATLMELEPEARRQAMSELADGRREAMAAALAELGIDPAVLAEHRAEHRAEHGSEHGAERGPQQQRRGPGMHR